MTCNKKLIIGLFSLFPQFTLNRSPVLYYFINPYTIKIKNSFITIKTIFSHFNYY